MTMTLGEDVYYYVLNIQGDVTGIVDSSGTLMITYYYEGYGECYHLSDTSDMVATMSAHNHLLYRGYLLDKGTGLYYLQSRYYDPARGRFLNADALVSTGQGLLGNNMFAYCLNNPACRKDISGTTSQKIFEGESDLDPTDDDKDIAGGKMSSPNSGLSGQGNGIAGDGSKGAPYAGGSYSAGQFQTNNPGANPQYAHPEGGGGVTNSITVDSVTVSFNHGGRHVDASNYNYLDIEQVIAHDVVNQPQYLNATKNVTITYDGLHLLYSYHYLNYYHISVGTYYFPDLR